MRCILLSCLIAWLNTAKADDVTIIASPAVPGNVEKIELQRLYLGKRTTLKDQKITPVDLPENSSERETFYRNVIGKSQVQMTRYWARAIFTGEALPPVKVNNAKEVKAKLASEPAIGYVAPNAVDKTTRIVHVTEGGE